MIVTTEQLIFGCLCIVLSILYFIPPIWVSYTKKNIDGKSMPDIFIGLVFAFVLLVYSTLTQDFAMITISVIMGIANVCSTIMHYYYPTPSNYQPVELDYAL